MTTRIPTALGRFNHWRAEADKLPLPTMDGERCVSPAGVAFQAYVLHDVWNRHSLIGWEMCGRDWSGTGVMFRERLIG